MRNRALNKYAKILLIEDDKNLCQLLAQRLRASGYQTTARYDGKSGLVEAISNKYGLVIVDIGLPELSGTDLIRRVRESGISAPIIAVTSQRDRKVQYQTFANGVSIFHNKPIDFELLDLQIDSLLRFQLIPEVLECGDLYIELHNYKVMRSNLQLDLSKRELQLLSLLVVNKQHVLSRAELINRLSAGRANLQPVEEGSIDTLISRIRSKIGKYNDEEIIETVHGIGYRINPDFCEKT